MTDKPVVGRIEQLAVNPEYGAGPAKKFAMKPWTHEEHLEARVAELEAENKQLRELLSEVHGPMVVHGDGDWLYTEVEEKEWLERRDALLEGGDG